jgi:hypothetical protein
MRTVRGITLCLLALALLSGDGRVGAQASTRWLTYEQQRARLPNYRQ